MEYSLSASSIGNIQYPNHFMERPYVEQLEEENGCMGKSWLLIFARRLSLFKICMYNICLTGRVVVGHSNAKRVISSAKEKKWANDLNDSECQNEIFRMATVSYTHLTLPTKRIV